MIQDKIFTFDKEPDFAQLWDKCVYGLLYNMEEYKKDLEKLFVQLEITKDSKIIDVAAGGGFPSLDLIKDGYDIECTDGWQDEVDVFNAKAEKSNLVQRCKILLWKDLQQFFSDDSFDLLLCRGNSFIYASGGWNEMMNIDTQRPLVAYKETLSIFYSLLKPGAWIYLDKFKDDETPHKDKVCDVQVNGKEKEQLIFWTQRFPEQKIRKASMIRKIGNMEASTPNITYDLSGIELEKMLAEVGFQNIKKIKLDSERHFDIWIAQK